jgi:hypothetical protein
MSKINKIQPGDFIAYSLSNSEFTAVLVIEVYLNEKKLLVDEIFRYSTNKFRNEYFKSERIFYITENEFETYDDQSQNFFHKKLLELDDNLIPEKIKYLRLIKLKKLKRKILFN